MRAGKLRERITVQAFTETKGSNGEPTKTWTNLKSFWAEVRVLTERSHTREEFEAAQVNPYTRYDFRCRRVTGIDTSMRIVFEGRVFDIEAVINVGLLGRDAVIHARERHIEGVEY